jgi:hypothetical protein
MQGTRVPSLTERGNVIDVDPEFHHLKEGDVWLCCGVHLVFEVTDPGENHGHIAFISSRNHFRIFY